MSAARPPSAAPLGGADPGDRGHLGGLGGWLSGDPVGWREFAHVGTLATESGEPLPDVVVAYQTYGVARRDQQGRATNAVLVCHALTGDAHVSGPPGPGQPTPGWWNGVVGEGSALDPADWFIVCANMLGGCQGTTGPSSTAPDGRPWGSRFPCITIRDQVEVERRLADHLGVERWAAVLGGSMGGMRVLEWVASHPERVDAALVLAVGARAHADQIGAYYAQIAAIEGDRDWQGGDYHGTGRAPYRGMGIARRLAQLTYRGLEETEARFGNAAQTGEDPLRGGRFAVESYLDHHAGKLAARFDPGTYVVATRAMNTHDVGRGRGGAAAALGAAMMPVVIAGISTDRLYPLPLQRQLAELIPGCEGLRVIDSPHGHDAFLLDLPAVGDLVAETLAASAPEVERCA